MRIHFERSLLPASRIRKFINLEEGATILVCGGYAPNQRTDVYIYGFARVTGPFRADTLNGTKWRFKHQAIIQPIEASLPRDIIANARRKTVCAKLSTNSTNKALPESWRL
jgi:hypothetical protein